MVQLTLYGSRQATCTQRVLILLEELKLKYDFVNVDLMKQEQKSEEYLKLQPFGKVPVLQYDSEYVFESRAILRYLAKHNIIDEEDEKLDLSDENNVDVSVWLEVESQNYNPFISKIVYEKIFKKMQNKETDESVVKSNLEELKSVLNVYEQRLSNFKYIGGHSYSIADISHIPYTNYFIKCGLEYKDFLKEFPNTYRWLKRIMNRPVVKSVLEWKE